MDQTISSTYIDPLSSYKRQKLDNFLTAPYDKEDLLIGEDRSLVALSSAKIGHVL